MDTMYYPYLVGAIGTIIASVITAKYTKRKVENFFLTQMQTSYSKLIKDLEETNTRLIEERENEIEKKEEYRVQIDSMSDKMQKLLAKYAIVELQRCLLPNCLNRVLP